MGRIACLVVVPILLTLGGCTFPETKMEPVEPIATSSARAPARADEDGAKRRRPPASSAAPAETPPAASH